MCILSYFGGIKRALKVVPLLFCDNDWCWVLIINWRKKKKVLANSVSASVAQREVTGWPNGIQPVVQVCRHLHKFQESEHSRWSFLEPQHTKVGLSTSTGLTSRKPRRKVMAASSSFPEDELLCPRCSDIYCFPVTLKCGHNVCQACLLTFWEWKGCRECPVCGVVSIPGRPPINLELKIAADRYQEKRSNKNQEVCCLHNESLKIFCQNDEQPICLVCQISVKHRIHECFPVEEAAKEKKVA